MKPILRYSLIIGALGVLILAFLFLFIIVRDDLDSDVWTDVTVASGTVNLDNSTPGLSAGGVVTSKPITSGDLEDEYFGDNLLLKRRDPQMFDLVASMSWISDGIDEKESDAALALIGLSIENTARAKQFIELPWFADGVNEDESLAFHAIAHLFFEAPRVATKIASLPWVNDGIDEYESKAIGSIPDLVRESSDSADEVVSKSWFIDGINNDEASLVWALGDVSYESGSASLLVNMPFMVTVEATDSMALNSLANLAFESSDSLDALLSHPVVADGVTDDETISLTLAANVMATTPELVGALLNQAGTLTEARKIDLPESGESNLRIVRTREGAAGNMDLLEDAVRFMESYIGEPFPTKNILLLYADIADSGLDGYNYGYSMVLDTRFDIDSSESPVAERVLVHELAHYYWHSSAQSWLDEGASEIMFVIYTETNSPHDALERLERAYENVLLCADADDLRSLEQLTGRRAEKCAYSFGLLFFLELYLALNPDDFQKGLRELYLSGEDAIGPEDYRARSIDHVRTAFSFSPKMIDEIILKWYGADQ